MSCGDGIQNVASSFARLQEIEDSVRSVLDGQRFWLTPQEFLANVEAHRRAHDNKVNPQSYDHSKCKVVLYELRRRAICNRQREFSGLEVAR